MMRAVIVKQPGDASQLVIADYPKPNPSDFKFLSKKGLYPPPPGASELLGVEISGIVEEVGKNVTKFKKGDAVFGLMGGGGYAEYAVLEESLALLKPENISFEQAAAIPETWFTAYQALFLVSKLQKDEDVLIHAGASGVSLCAIQLAKAAGAKRIFVTCGSEKKIKFCKSLGATHGINYKTQDWAKIIAEETGSKGVNVIVDYIGKNYFNQNLETLGLDGRMVILAFMSGPVVENANIGPILRKRLRIEGSTLRSRSVEYQANLCQQVYDHAIKEHLCSTGEGKFKVIIDSVFDWKDIVKATEYMESDQSMGKIVMVIP